jgi:hypothetical protein
MVVYSYIPAFEKPESRSPHPYADSSSKRAMTEEAFS